MKALNKVVLAVAGALALTATTASAEIVCNDEGDCWHTKTRHEYKPDFNLSIQPDNWKWADSDSKRYRWREHDGRGFWRKGVWIEF